MRGGRGTPGAWHVIVKARLRPWFVEPCQKRALASGYADDWGGRAADPLGRRRDGTTTSRRIGSD